MSENKEVLLHQGEGTSYWVLGDLYTFKVTGKQTNGEFTMVEEVIQPQSGPPLHVHHREDETFYILEGSFRFMCGGVEQELGAGSTVYVPKGTAHTFQNIGEGKGRMICFITPAGLEEFFYEIGTPATDLNTPVPFDEAVLDKIMQLTHKYNFDVLHG